MVQVLQVGLALQLHCSLKGRHGAAPKAACHAGKVIAQLQQLLELPHLHLIVGCCPATPRQEFTCLAGGLILQVSACTTYSVWQVQIADDERPHPDC